MKRNKKFGGITVAGVPQKEEKNWGGQILVTLVLGVLFIGPWVVVLVFYRHDFLHGGPAPAGSAHDRSTHASVAAVAAIVALDVVLLVVIALRAVRTWRW